MAATEPTSTSTKPAKVTTTAVRLDADEVDRLDRLAERHTDGDRSATIRLALQRLEIEDKRVKALDEYLADAWAEHGGVDEEAVAKAGRRYFS